MSVHKALKLLNWKSLSFKRHYCSLCQTKRTFIKLDNNSISVRCLACKASGITLSIINVINQIMPNIEGKEVYELSSRGILFEYLNDKTKLTCSEYFKNITPGEYCNGVQCQDVQNLTFSDENFDLCTSTEVFEHVPDDRKGFAETHRVLKPNGFFIFTVPLDVNQKTIERATLDSDGNIQHHLPAEYHTDPIRNNQSILAFRNYGYDIVDRLLQQGFKQARILQPHAAVPWQYNMPVVVATKCSKEMINLLESTYT